MENILPKIETSLREDALGKEKGPRGTSPKEDTPPRTRDKSQRDQSRGRDHSQDRSRFYRDQSRGRESSRDRYQSNSGQKRDSRYPSEDRNRTRSDFQSKSRDEKDSKSYRDQSRDRSYPCMGIPFFPGYPITVKSRFISTPFFRFYNYL